MRSSPTHRLTRTNASWTVSSHRPRSASAWPAPGSMSPRYADTFGYDNDYENRLWPWRDWLIGALNDNLSYDQFLRWQIAGDLVESPTDEQLVATAFNRLHRQNAEGGALAEEFLVEYRVDRTQTFATAFLGVTLECARCHDHKFDPISQRDYYSLYALFANIDEAGLHAEKTGATPTPNAFLYSDGQRGAHDKLRQRIRAAESALADVRDGARERFAAWRVQEATAIGAVDPVCHLTFESRGDASARGPKAKLPGSAELVPGRVGRAARLSGDDGIAIGQIGELERTDAFTISAWLHRTASDDRMVVAHNSKPAWEVGRRGLEIVIDAGRLEIGLSHFWPGNAIRVRTRDALRPETWTHVAFTYDGSSRASGLAMFVDGRQVSCDVVRDHLYGSIRLPRNPPFVIGAQTSELGFRDGAVDEFRFYDVRLTALEVARVAQEAHPADSKSLGETPGERALFEAYLERVDVEYGAARDALRTARETENAFSRELRSIMVMRELPSPPRARVLLRGSYEQPGELVGPGVPRALLDPGDEPPENRLELTDWLLRPDHPLTPRVAVNRIWGVLFGRGIVETLEDFGSQGSLPSHPELLDSLSHEFVASGWNVKALVRHIVTSATYRQSSRARGDLVAADPRNVLLARGPRHRLSAESIRDAALAACGTLTRRVGGSSVRPYQPAGLWREVGPKTFQMDQGDKPYRRSLYTFWKRTSPPPSMLAFDAINREVCVARRERTVTPAQALVLLNDPQFVEPARVLAADVTRRHGENTERAVIEIVRRLIGRAPSNAELRELLAAHSEQRELFATAPENAKAYTSVGPWPRDEALDPVDVAAMASVVQLVMNFFEFQLKR